MDKRRFNPLQIENYQYILDSLKTLIKENESLKRENEWLKKEIKSIKEQLEDVDNDLIISEKNFKTIKKALNGS
jgi:cell division septum initiation protein DivIVA